MGAEMTDGAKRPMRLDANLHAALSALDHSIESRPRVLSGVPVFKGTRFSIPQFFAELAEGESIDSIAEEFDVDRESLSSVLHALAVCLNQPMCG
jgi:uncharacterized protein (DUF433 family)